MPESAEKRSAVMRAVKGRDTRPELTVRRLLHALGYRFRLHVPDVPGRPDIAWRGRRKAIFVHGCFWHGHDCPRGSRRPVNNAMFWAAKIARNRARDAETAERLAAMGWTALTLWECELKDGRALAARLVRFLGPPRTPGAALAM